ncbi:hypothetical protein [Streptomyces sp. CB02400]|nr:hypothetical protein [Streptomyces sp. CB02400]
MDRRPASGLARARLLADELTDRLGRVEPDGPGRVRVLGQGTVQLCVK